MEINEEKRTKFMENVTETVNVDNTVTTSVDNGISGIENV